MGQGDMCSVGQISLAHTFLDTYISNSLSELFVHAEIFSGHDCTPLPITYRLDFRKVYQPEVKNDMIPKL